MKKSGRTAAGTQRWKCTTCNASTAAAASAAPSLRSRRRSGPHPQETANFALFISWITSSSSQARLYHGDDRAFRRRTSWCWQVPVPAPNPAARDLDQVFIDGIWLHHDWVLLIARTTTDVIGWQWAARESTTAYQALLTPIPPPQVETTDGAPAALKAIATSWPTTRIQRCLIHIRRDTVCDLPLRPRTTQGRALLGLSRKLMTATTDQDDPATAALTGKKWWYNHPRTRRAYKRLERLTRQNVLFTYLTCGDTTLERTTNPVESVNARIRDALRHHRRATPDHQAAIAEWTLHTYTHQPATPEQILTTWHTQGRPPRQRIPTTPTVTNTTHPGWGTTPTPQKGLCHAKAGPDTPTNPTTRRLKHHVHADNPTHPS
jgi:transposase, mutator family